MRLSRIRLVPVAALVAVACCVPAAAQDGRLLDQHPVVLSEAEVERLESRTPGIRDVLGRVDVQSITYLSDGLRVKGYLLQPRSGDSLPAVIYNRGGSADFGAMTDGMVARVLAPIADRGYVVIASQYRGNAGGEGREEVGGADVNDVLNLLPLLGSLPRVDTTRIGMYGWSRGGKMTYLALARTGRIRAAIIGAGVADVADLVQRRRAMEDSVYALLVPRWQADRDAEIEARSAIRWPERLHKQTPILLLHGSSDWRVHPEQALRMAAALHAARHPFRFVFFEGGDHGLTAHAAEVGRLVFDWLDTYVRDRRTWPSLEPHGR
jgi:dipeptidyl aminopeptidase/acylaminoacyl peptidase